MDSSSRHNIPNVLQWAGGISLTESVKRVKNLIDIYIVCRLPTEQHGILDTILKNVLQWVGL